MGQFAEGCTDTDRIPQVENKDTSSGLPVKIREIDQLNRVELRKFRKYSDSNQMG